MKVSISPFRKYLVLADLNKAGMKRHIVDNEGLKALFLSDARICEIGEIQNFEIYTKCPKTGTTGWDIHHVSGVKEYIARFYPNFDCFITDGGTPDDVEFFQTDHVDNDYPLA